MTDYYNESLLYTVSIETFANIKLLSSLLRVNRTPAAVFFRVVNFLRRFFFLAYEEF
jgi:hypothetical protein